MPGSASRLTPSHVHNIFHQGRFGRLDVTLLHNGSQLPLWHGQRLTGFSAPLRLSYDAPDAGTALGQGTQAIGISSAGEIVGYYVDPTGVYYGFVRAADGTITEFNAKGSGSAVGQGTASGAIDKRGTTAGYYLDSSSVAHGFVRTPKGKITEFDVAGAGTSRSQGTMIYAINDSGDLSGFYVDSGTVHHGFLIKP